jgi:hypothetical protein
LAAIPHIFQTFTFKANVVLHQSIFLLNSDSSL